MIQISNTLISEDILEREFVCNLSACKGICCVEGDSGAPLEEDELPVLKAIYSKIKPYMRAEGVAAVETQGPYLRDGDGDWVTPLVRGRGPCAYVVFERDGVARCAIEKAYERGEIPFKKPISCHLYPIRINEYGEYTAVNYHCWSICQAACELGRSLKIPVYKFLKDPLIQKFGVAWYEALESFAQDRAAASGQ